MCLGDGGNGVILKFLKLKVDDGDKKFKKEKKIFGIYKRGFDGFLILFLGGYGGDVIFVVDESVDIFLLFYWKKCYNVKCGLNVSVMGMLFFLFWDGLDVFVFCIFVFVGEVFFVIIIVILKYEYVI